MGMTAMAVTSNQGPTFDMATTTREVAENTAAGMNIGDPVTATDPDEDTLTYALSGDDAASFGFDTSTGQLMTMAALDYETKSSYMVTVTATDPDGLTGSIAVAINVTNVDEPGMLTLSPMEPLVGTEMTATLTDPDGVVEVEWQWSRSMTLEGTFTHIDEETSSYTPKDDDVGYYLKVAVTYTDGEGSGKELEGTCGRHGPAPAAGQV